MSLSARLGGLSLGSRAGASSQVAPLRCPAAVASPRSRPVAARAAAVDGSPEEEEEGDKPERGQRKRAAGPPARGGPPGRKPREKPEYEERVVQARRGAAAWVWWCHAGLSRPTLSQTPGVARRESGQGRQAAVLPRRGGDRQPQGRGRRRRREGEGGGRRRPKGGDGRQENALRGAHHGRRQRAAQADGAGQRVVQRDDPPRACRLRHHRRRRRARRARAGGVQERERQDACGLQPAQQRAGGAGSAARDEDARHGGQVARPHNRGGACWQGL